MFQYSCLESPTPWQSSLAGYSPQGHRVGHYRSDPAHISTRLFLPVAALPQWELSVKVAQLLGLLGPWWCQVCRDTDCLHCRSYGPIRVFFWGSCRWQSEDLFDQSFSVAPPIQGLKGLPWLGSLSVVWCVRYIEGTPWLESYSVDPRVRHLKGHPGWVLLCSSVCQAFWRASLSIAQLPIPACGKERLWWWLHPLRVTQQCAYVCLASTAAWVSSIGISHQDLLPHITSIHLFTVKSSSHPEIAPQSLNSSS